MYIQLDVFTACLLSYVPPAHDIEDILNIGISKNHCPHTGETSCTRPSAEQVSHFLHQADLLCTARKLRFTELRRRVLELVCKYAQPVGAYTLLDDLRAEGRSAAPPTIYRALDFLQQQGLVHRLATNNTYLACAHPQTDHEGFFLVCSACGYTQEVHTQALVKKVKNHAREFDFEVERASVEVTGLCRDCKEADSG
jgi:Fur family zinc uptake transcriptional regulator